MSVTLHTNLGTIKIEVFCESVPKTAEVNTLQPCRNKLKLINVLYTEFPCALRIWVLQWLAIP